MEDIVQKYSGTTLMGKYVLGSKPLGAGGFGAVFGAKHVIYGEEIRDVAVKIIKRPIPPGKEREIFHEAILQIKLQAEMQEIAAREKLIQIFDFGLIDEEERIGYIVMELIKGKDLQYEIKSYKGQLDENIARKYMIAICEGIADMHKLDPPLLHCDIKPENILLTEDKKVKIGDFGLAVRMIKEYGWAVGVSGTPTFMAPEAFAQISYTQSDVFSLGATYYYMLTGKEPFGDIYAPIDVPEKDEQVWRFSQRKNVVPPDPSRYNSTCSELTSKIINKCLDFDKNRRYRDAGELLNAIRSGPDTREEFLEQIKVFIQKEEYLKAVEMAELALKLPKPYEDKIDFLIRVHYAIALSNIQTKEASMEASKMFKRLRDKNHQLRWISGKEEIEVLKMELKLHEKNNNIPRINILKRMIEEKK